MAELIQLCDKIGLKDVKTYIQSGNIVFSSEEGCSEIEDKLEESIMENFGFEVPVIVRNSEDFRKSVENNPFFKKEVDSSKLHLTLLKGKPLIENIKQTEKYDYTPDIFAIENKDVYIYCDSKYHESKLTNNFFEKKLKLSATTRNWKTVLKLIEMSAD